MEIQPVTRIIMSNKHKVAVVVSNAGIKSLGALPILDFMQQENLPIDYIIGSGGGASLAALFSLGYLSEEIPRYMKRLYDRNTMLKLNYNTLMGMSGLRRRPFSPHEGLLNNKELLQAYSEAFKNVRLEDLHIKTALQATDILSGEGVVLTHGSLAESAYASNATFPFFPPAKINDRLLVDGLFSASLPLLHVLKGDYDLVIAFNFNQEYYNFGSLGLLEYYCNFFHRTYSIGQVSHATIGMMMSNTKLILISMNLSARINLWSIDRIPEILAGGEKLLGKHRDEIMGAFAHQRPA